MLVPPLARVSNAEIWGSAKLPTGWVCQAILGQPVAQPGVLMVARPTPLLMKAPPTMQLPRGFFVGTRRTGARFTSRPSPGTMRRNPVNRHAPAIDPQERVEEPPLR
jgi:hypothetical protein